MTVKPRTMSHIDKNKREKMKVIAKKSTGNAIWVGFLAVLLVIGMVMIIVSLCMPSEERESNAYYVLDAFLLIVGIVGVIACLVWVHAIRSLPKVLISLDDNDNLVLYDGRVIPIACVFNVTAENYRSGSYRGFKQTSGSITLCVTESFCSSNAICDGVNPDAHPVYDEIEITHVAFCEEVQTTIVNLVWQVRNGQKASLPETYDFC